MGTSRPIRSSSPGAGPGTEDVTMIPGDTALTLMPRGAKLVSEFLDEQRDAGLRGAVVGARTRKAAVEGGHEHDVASASLADELFDERPGQEPWAPDIGRPCAVEHVDAAV